MLPQWPGQAQAAAPSDLALVRLGPRCRREVGEGWRKKNTRWGLGRWSRGGTADKDTVVHLAGTVKCTVYTLATIGERKMYKVQGGGGKIDKHKS